MAARPVSWADIPVVGSVRRLSWVNMQSFDEPEAAVVAETAGEDAGSNDQSGPSVPEPQRPDTFERKTPAVVVEDNAAVQAAADSTADGANDAVSPRAVRHFKRQETRRRLLEAAATGTTAGASAAEPSPRRSKRKGVPRLYLQAE